MKCFKLEEYTRGWIVGDFMPAIFRTKAIEVGIKSYKKGEKEEKSVHKYTWEITIVISGEIKMYNKILSKNEIILLEPGDVSEFECIEDTSLVIVKYPSNPNDKITIK
ncbi:hypothetical protein [Prochlorococcus marinus]|uniref:hypothetical protein n=1 Tax=Prochlorococcus marinus TaxID=1219 RepID=UPI0022B4FABD|nr:hypothetical protein [Prochlorococcus marinus]